MINYIIQKKNMFSRELKIFIINYLKSLNIRYMLKAFELRKNDIH